MSELSILSEIVKNCRDLSECVGIVKLVIFRNVRFVRTKLKPVGTGDLASNYVNLVSNLVKLTSNLADSEGQIHG